MAVLMMAWKQYMYLVDRMSGLIWGDINKCHVEFKVHWELMKTRILNEKWRKRTRFRKWQVQDKFCETIYKS